MSWQALNKVQRIALITAHWNPDCSASSLASALSAETQSNVSRCAVIGLYTRNSELQVNCPLGGGGIEGWRSKNENRTKKPRKTNQSRPRTRRQRLIQTTDSVPVEPRPPSHMPRLSTEARAYDEAFHQVPLWEVGFNQCHWPVNSPPPGGRFLFCGHQTAEEQRYCDHHRGRAARKKGVVHYGDI